MSCDFWVDLKSTTELCEPDPDPDPSGFGIIVGVMSAGGGMFYIGYNNEIGIGLISGDLPAITTDFTSLTMINSSGLYPTYNRIIMFSRAYKPSVRANAWIGISFADYTFYNITNGKPSDWFKLQSNIDFSKFVDGEFLPVVIADTGVTVNSITGSVSLSASMFKGFDESDNLDFFLLAIRGEVSLQYGITFDFGLDLNSDHPDQCSISGISQFFSAEPASIEVFFGGRTFASINPRLDTEIVMTGAEILEFGSQYAHNEEGEITIPVTFTLYF